ncbi:MAG: asparagine synthase (glutamine-hydrolyzing) [Candidatus Dormibacteraeota bacterium]|nr:asparagine synthase (glutamine-hydrolyzing) [Candidatus Dormibacteraeota bacterium]
MTGCLDHRGPDEDGFLETAAASLGVRRLSIIDVAGGHQPCGNEDGLVQAVYNGELYNYRELRADLVRSGHVFRTEADTEVIVHAYEEWGAGCFARFNGMWGLALLDGRRPESPRLVLSRDHFGIKPLHWARSGDRLLFASEIKALLQDPGLERRPDDARLHEYLVAGLHDHDERTFFAGVRSLPAASYAVLDAGHLEPAPSLYWQPVVATDQEPDPRRFHDLFERAVERRLVADVPVGTCLSGGLDSSTVVCLMTDLLRREVPDAASMGERLKTFSAVFGDDPIDESGYMAPVLQVTGAEQHTVQPGSERFFEELPHWVWHQDQPLVSTGPYAQWCVMRLARGKVKVLLNGQGGDELLGGYVPYQFVYLRQLRRERRYGRAAAEAWAARDVLWPPLWSRLRDRGRDVPVRRLLEPAWLDAQDPIRDPRIQDDLKRRLLQDFTAYSLPTLLRYEDRNSMAHSIESRLPYLDVELVSWALRLPEAALIRGGWARWILRESMAGVLPEKVRKRRWKVGFTTPELRWLRAERAQVRSLLRSPSFQSRPYWDGAAVARAFDAWLEGRHADSLIFWRVLNVELWLRVFFDRPRFGPEEVEAVRLEWAGDRRSAQLAGTAGADSLMARFHPNPGRHLFATAGGGLYARVPVRTRLILAGGDLLGALSEGLGRLGPDGRPMPGDVVAVGEKAVAAAQGRSYPIAEIRPGRLARALARFTTRSRVGIGLGLPATMELAVREVGPARIVAAAALAGMTRPLGLKGLFYRVAGRSVAAIDGPTAYTLPPFNEQASMGPDDPGRVAAELSRELSREAGGPVGVAIVDSNDLGVTVLAASGAEPALVRDLFADNPLGQRREQTPAALIRKVG